jgi:hypothetical protein
MTGLKANASNFPDRPPRPRHWRAWSRSFGLSSGVFTLIGNGFFGAHTQASLVAVSAVSGHHARRSSPSVGGLLCNHVPDSLMPIERHSPRKRLWGASTSSPFLSPCTPTVDAVLSR